MEEGLQSESNNIQQTNQPTSNSVQPLPVQSNSPVMAQLPVLHLPISRLHVIVEVADRYKPLFTQLLYIFQDMFEKRDKRLLFDLQPLAAYIRPEKAEGFKNLLNEVRNHFNILIRNSMECKKRLIQLRSRFTTNEEIDVIDGALELLNLPSSSEIQSDADFKLLGLQQSVSDVDTAIEIQEIFIYLNNMFAPVDESAQRQDKSRSSRGSSRTDSRRR